MKYQSLLHKFQPDIPVSKCFMEYFTNIYDTNQPTMTIPKTSGGNPWRNPLKTDSKSTGYGFLLTDLLSSRIFFFQNPVAFSKKTKTSFRAVTSQPGEDLLSTVGDEEGIQGPLKFNSYTLPETNSSPLKIDLWKRRLVWKPPYFRGELIVLGSFFARELRPKPKGIVFQSPFFRVSIFHDYSSLGIQSPRKMMSKGCRITSSERYLGSMKPFSEGD